MKPKPVEKNLSSGKERVDREEQTKYKFDTLRLEVKYPGTAILLLQCEEKPILLAAAAALAKYGTKSQENLEILFDLEIVKSVIPLIEHEDLFTRRFAAMLLAEMTAIRSVKHYLLESDYYIPHFTKVLVNEKDVFMQEFSSLILTQLSKDAYGAGRLLSQCSNMNFLFERIQSPDPDVKKNNIEIMFNLLQDPAGVNKILEAKEFNLTRIYELFNSPYPEIQRLALNVVRDLVTCSKIDRLQDLFRQTKGLQALLKFLDNDEWEDLHADALKILCLASDNPKTVELLDDIGGIRQILKYVENTANSKLFLDAFDVAVRLSHTPAGRKALYAYGIVDYLLHGLRGTVQADMYEISCHGVGMMALYSPAAKQLTAENCVKNVLDLVKNENLKWTAREAAVFALQELLKYDVENCQFLVDARGQDYLMRMINQSADKVPLEVQTGAVECLTAIGRQQSLRDTIINTNLIEALCSPFEATCPTLNELKIACCNALSIFCVEETGRDAFLKVHGPNKLYHLLTNIESTPVRSAAVHLVQLLSADPVLSDAFVKARYLPYMLNNRSSARVIPAWNTCIDALFDSHLPIKFAFTGRLSLHDLTPDGFYVLRRNICPFPLLDDVFRLQFSTMEPIYVVNCVRHEKTSEGGDMPDLKFCRLQCDPYLCEYVDLFKCKLIAAESADATEKPGLVNIRYVASRAEMLGKFVDRQMSGPDPARTCFDHQLEVHLMEIKNVTETSVIPLGMLRVGSYLERALLFKVIADRICLPAALVRGEYGKAWVEIAVPEIVGADEETTFDAYLRADTSCPEIIRVNSSKERGESTREIGASVDNRRTVLPARLMKPNFIVDLVHVPGDLIPIDSHRAELYREKRLVRETVCCD